MNYTLFNTTLKRNCEKIWNDFEKCKNSDKNIIIGDIFNDKPFEFNFLECEQYKNNMNKISNIQFNPTEIKYPYNTKYIIEKKENLMKISLTD